MNSKLTVYAKKYYPDSKSDLFAVMIERCSKMTRESGYQAMITQHAWMFLSSFERLRTKLLQIAIVNMAHLGARAFEEIGGEVVQTTCFVLRKIHLPSYKGIYCRLIEPTTQQGKDEMYLAGKNRYIATQDHFSKIPGSPVAYWISIQEINLFQNKAVGDFAISDGQNITGDNERFLRFFWEVPLNDIGKDRKWVLCARGGAYRKWYGNVEEVIDWSITAREHYKADKIARIVPEYIRFRKGISWSRIASANIGFRLLQDNELFEKTGVSIFVQDDSQYSYILALLNSSVTKKLMELITQVITLQVRDVFSIPVVSNLLHEIRIPETVTENISMSKSDWDSFETSWDFERHPLISVIAKNPILFERGHIHLSECYQMWEAECNERFDKLKSNEEELNRIFIDIYGLQDELTPDVEDKDVTVRKADLERDIRSLISYAVGCMFGRYSLVVPGLVYAGGEWPPLIHAIGVREQQYPDADQNICSWMDAYGDFCPDSDNIIPICDNEYFEDDIVGRFIYFIEVVYGKETLDENLKFIADALGGKGQPKEVIRNYFLNDFFNDHCKIYQKRPIYWQFDSGKKNGFKCLIYMHRYEPDTIARIRTDYLHEQQGRYRTAIADLEIQITKASTGERVKLNKKLAALRAQAEEARVYEEKVHHLADQMISIDLDDGVKHNYELFQDVLAKIK